MKWKVELKAKARKSLNKLDKQVQQRIASFLEQLVLQGNPRSHGKALTGEHTGLWRYRIGDYRLICQLQDEKITLLVLELGHRKNVYKQL